MAELGLTGFPLATMTLTLLVGTRFGYASRAGADDHDQNEGLLESEIRKSDSGVEGKCRMPSSAVAAEKEVTAQKAAVARRRPDVAAGADLSHAKFRFVLYR
ncbi:uncharacterized protein MELLADRAFT_104353 [Melampsora larici-populina 98AG31]|uniref:Secreted protein n=1 Tax=Melampsora larici-populina (strain 98AG31 / pathotype 3-4-7) TaxID=747676 RepID=F4REE9_MELLP|nr:uncharacterized protein MELLADRAFT_104353 [Melampsora larici-populina 98AG31]EGG09282.1 secreted protein [Melampsora larici-populina 98AG31]